MYYIVGIGCITVQAPLKSIAGLACLAKQTLLETYTMLAFLVELVYMTEQVHPCVLGAYGSSFLSTGPHTDGTRKSRFRLQ